MSEYEFLSDGPSPKDMPFQDYHEHAARVRVLTVPRDIEDILALSTQEMFSDEVRIVFTPDSKLGPQINGLSEIMYAWSGGLVHGGYRPIASALEKHSALADPNKGNAWDRMFLTGKYIGQIVASQDAVRAGKVVRHFHRNIDGVDRDGNPIHSTDSQHYIAGWVPIMRITEQSHRNFTSPESPEKAESPEWWESWWQEARIAYQVQGVSDEFLPPDYGSYREYFNTLCATQLERTPVITEALRRMKGDIDRPPQIHPQVWKLPGVKTMLSKFVFLAGIGGLPPAAREAMELDEEWKPEHQEQYDKLRINYSKWREHIPPRLRTQPMAVSYLYPPTNKAQAWQIKAATGFYNLAYSNDGDRLGKNQTRTFQ